MELHRIIDSIKCLPAQQRLLIEEITEEINLPKHHKITETGRPMPYIYFQKEGICRIFYYAGIKEVVLGFTFPGDVLLSLNYYAHGESGYETIETLENSTLYRIPIGPLQDLFDRHTDIANWGRKLAELEALKIEDRLMLRLFKSAKESYQELLEKAPDLILRIKLGHIASYLGISQVTLSRIRSEKKY